MAKGTFKKSDTEQQNSIVLIILNILVVKIIQMELFGPESGKIWSPNPLQHRPKCQKHAAGKIYTDPNFRVWISVRHYHAIRCRVTNVTNEREKKNIGPNYGDWIRLKSDHQTQNRIVTNVAFSTLKSHSDFTK